VAIKRLHPRHAANPREHNRLTAEGRLGLALPRHESIVRTLTLGAEDGFPYVVLEYVDGRSLREVVAARKKLTDVEVLALAKGLVLGLRFLHDARVCHKDLKPDNIMIRKDGTVKMLDFGFAERAGGLRLFERRHLEGSLPYMAPELFMTKRATPATDLYSLGCTLYECAAGFTPFGAMADKEVVAKQTDMRLAAPPLREANPGISLATEAMIMTAVEKNIARRYKSADEMLLDLARNHVWRGVKDPAPILAETALASPVPRSK
jgi:serine/threonine-protein kinase